MGETTLFTLCPGCGERGMIERVQAGYRCCVCNFDYVSLSRDPAALERWMVPNIREDPQMVMLLHHLITQSPRPVSQAAVLAVQQRYGITPPKGGLGWLLAIVALAFVLIAAAIGVGLYFGLR